MEKRKASVLIPDGPHLIKPPIWPDHDNTAPLIKNGAIGRAIGHKEATSNHNHEGHEDRSHLTKSPTWPKHDNTAPIIEDEDGAIGPAIGDEEATSSHDTMDMT